MRAVGIDFGTSNSVVSVLEAGGPVVIANAEGGRLTPSIVAFGADGQVLVGEPARRRAVVEPGRCFRSVKRRLEQPRVIDVDGRVYSAVDVATVVLTKLKRDAEAYLGEPVTDAVIAVPASMFQSQRFARAEAARAAGLRLLRVMYEPTAAALAYGLRESATEQTILVFDLGGGTFDVSVVQLADGVVQVRSTSGNSDLGGDDWDGRIVEDLVATLAPSTASMYRRTPRPCNASPRRPNKPRLSSRSPL